MLQCCSIVKGLGRKEKVEDRILGLSAFKTEKGRERPEKTQMKTKNKKLSHREN